MNVYIIQPDFNSVAQMTTDDEFGLDKIYQLLSTDVKQVRTIDAVRDYSNPENTDIIYIDDEGLLIDENYAFSFNDNAYFGRGIVIGTDDKGNNTSPIMPIEYYIKSIRCNVGLLQTEEYLQPPIFVPMD